MQESSFVKTLVKMAGTRGYKPEGVRVFEPDECDVMQYRHTAYVWYDPAERLFDVRLVSDDNRYITQFTVNLSGDVKGYDSMIERHTAETDVPNIVESVNYFRLATNHYRVHLPTVNIAVQRMVQSMERCYINQRQR